MPVWFGGPMCVTMPHFMLIGQTVAQIWLFFHFSRWRPSTILNFKKSETLTAFCSLAIFDLWVGHIMHVLSLFISVLCHSDCDSSTGSPVHILILPIPGRAWSSPPACTWHCSLHYLSPGNSLVSSWCDHSTLASLL